MNDDERPSVRRMSSGVHVVIALDRTSDHNLWSDLMMEEPHGVFIATFHRLTLGTVVHLVLTLEGDPTPLAASGVVRWSSSHREGTDNVAGVGLRFVDLDDAAAAKLARFMSHVREPIVFELEELPMRTRSANG
ncbi:PilZ domain-containing protein [Labilithrix luteola]|nr:PilZ domain-containing protein [Labilithrix luteola]